MKKFYLLLMLIGLALFSQSKSYGQLLLHESFSYTLPGTIGGNGAAGTSNNNWTTHSVTAGQTTTDTLYSGNLTFSGLAASTGEKLHFFSFANTLSRDVNSVLLTNTNTITYYSVLINVIDSSQISLTTFDYFMSFGATSGASVTSLGGRLGIKAVNANKANFRLGVSNISGGTPTYTEYTQDLNFGTTYLVVVKYDRSASPTVASLWVNPASLGGTEPAGSITNNSGTSTFAAFSSICLRNNGVSPKVFIDEIRVGTTWADVTPVGAITPTLTATPTSLTGFTYTFGSGPSASQSYDLSGTDLTGAPGNITVTAPADYEVSLDDATFSASVNVPYTTGTLAATPVYVRLITGLAVATYNSEIITNGGGGATTINVTCSGDVTAAPTPELTATPNSLSGFTYIFGSGPSASQSYDLSGTDLTGAPANITVTAPTDYEVSLDDVTFSASVNVPYTTATLAATPVYVRLIAGLAVATYNSEIITNAGGGATTIDVTCSGDVTAVPTPVLTATPNTLTGFYYVASSGGPSASQSYDLSGTDLTGAPGNITVTAPADYEVSLDDVTFSASVNVPYTAAILTSTPVYVRLISGLSAATYNSEIITNAGGGATNIDVTCSGDVTTVPIPILTATPNSLTGFTYIAGSGPSTSQSYDLSGADLTGAPADITITAPADYEVSLDDVTFSASVNVPYTTGTLAATPVYVRLISGLAVATYNSEIITNAGGGATTVNVNCSGDVTAIPTPILTATPNTLTGFTYVAGSGPSASQTYNLSGTDLTGAPANITVTAPTDYEVSMDDVTFSASVNVPYTTATLAATPVYVRLIAGLAVATYNSEIITNAGGGATTIDVTCSGDVTDVLPCLSENFSGFTAGSHASPGTTDLSSTLDTYTQITGWTGSKVYSAGGEIKMGTSSLPGYIVTPTIDLSAGDANLSFDLQRYNNDSTNKVLVYHAADGVTFTAIDSLPPTLSYSTHTTLITGGTTLSKIKIGTSAKRTFLDNVSVMCDFVVSITENNENTFVNIYPNPVNDNLTIAVEKQTKEIAIYDMLGNVVYNTTSPNSVTTINTDNMNKGIYIVKVIFNDNSFVTKRISVL